MIGKLARKTAEKFVENDNIFYDKISIYQYGFFVFYSNIFFLIITSIIGAIFSAFLQSVVFFFAFFLIRQLVAIMPRLKQDAKYYPPYQFYAA